ncbi:MAG TPA: alpha/beta hydrolase [Vicinamibacterales bacterium]|nr:alpha/beta hydrolase [Vicinamibacterales bacterium]
MEFGFLHRYGPPRSAGAPTLLLLHGTGGNEEDLLPLARMLAPDAGVLSPRGKVLERGMPRFFRRLAEGVFDEEDLRTRTAELASFVREAGAHYAFDPREVIAVGFSNGANIAASLLLLEPDVLSGAILFRAMVPLVPETLPSLQGRSVLLSNGRLDPLAAPGETERLAAMLREAGADVEVVWQPAGHELTAGDISRAREWLTAVRSETP